MRRGAPESIAGKNKNHKRRKAKQMKNNSNKTSKNRKRLSPKTAAGLVAAALTSGAVGKVILLSSLASTAVAYPRFVAN
jgi:hypothetical protein